MKAPSLLPILRSDVQARLPTTLLLDPERELSVTDVADISETSVSTAVREVDRAEQAGIVRSRNVGRTRLVAANTRSFAYEPLRELLLRAFGPLAVVTTEFRQPPWRRSAVHLRIVTLAFTCAPSAQGDAALGLYARTRARDRNRVTAIPDR